MHLPNVDGRVDRVAHVHHDVGSAQLEITGQHIQLNLGHCSIWARMGEFEGVWKEMCVE